MKKFKKRKGAKPIGSRNEKMYDAPPSDFKVQEIPRSLKEFMLLKESAKDSENIRRMKSRSTKLTVFKKPPKSSSSKKINTTMSSSKKLPVADSPAEGNVEFRKSKMKQKRKLKLMKLKEKRKQKKLQHKLESDADKEEFSKDSVEFGEVVHRPPQLSVLPRKVAQSGFQNRPGRKDDLLLKSLLKRKHSKYEFNSSNRNLVTGWRSILDCKLTKT